MFISVLYHLTDDYLNEESQELHSKDRPVTGRDLMCWSFQIARGMEYLASIGVSDHNTLC